MTEFALVAPMLLVAMMFLIEGGLALTAAGSAQFSANEAARIESTLGKDSSSDSSALAAIRATPLGTTRIATVESVAIYRVTMQSGSFQEDSSHANVYLLNGSVVSQSWPPGGTRCTVNGQSDFVGVTVHFTYHWMDGLTGGLFKPVAMTSTSYSRLEPTTYEGTC